MAPLDARRVLRIAWLAAACAPTASARAQAPPLPPVAEVPAEPAPDPTRGWGTGTRGIELQIRGGAMVPGGASPVLAPDLYGSAHLSGDPTGDILRGKVSPYGVDAFGLLAAAGYRPAPWLSAGVFFAYASFPAQGAAGSGDY